MEGAGEGGRDGWKEGGPEAAMWQLFQPPRKARATAHGQEKLTKAVLAAALKGQFLHGYIFTPVNKKPQSDKSHIIKITVLISWVVLQVKSICFWVKKFHLFLGVEEKSIHVDFEHFG